MQIWWIPTVLPTQSHPQHQSPPDKQVCVSNTGWQTNQDIHKISLIQTTFGSWKSAQQELFPSSQRAEPLGHPDLHLTPSVRGRKQNLLLSLERKRSEMKP